MNSFNMRKEKQKLQNPNKNGAAADPTNDKLLFSLYPRAWLMTSKDFYDDPDARVDAMMSRVKDKTTLNCFRRAICYNRHLFIGRQVLILNCGVDLLLTLWAIKLNAAHIYGIDTSNAIEYLRNIICTNNLNNNNNVSLYHGRVQDIELPVKEIDVIISNWMGYCLIFDSKCEDVIYARDKWLKKGTGIIFPDVAHLYVVGVESSKTKNERVDWWRDVNGFNMNAIRKYALREPVLQSVHERELLTDPIKVWSINLYQINKEDLQCYTPFQFITKRSGVLEGILAFFDIHFSKSHTPTGFTTSPTLPISEQTHWLQTVFYFDDPVHVNAGQHFYSGIEIRPKIDKFDRNFYKIVIEIFSGARQNLSQLSHMIWYRKSRNSTKTNISKPTMILGLRKTENEDKDTNELTIKAHKRTKSKNTNTGKKSSNAPSNNTNPTEMKYSQHDVSNLTVRLEKQPNSIVNYNDSIKKKTFKQKSRPIAILEVKSNPKVNNNEVSIAKNENNLCEIPQVKSKFGKKRAGSKKTFSA